MDFVSRKRHGSFFHIVVEFYEQPANLSVIDGIPRSRFNRFFRCFVLAEQFNFRRDNIAEIIIAIITKKINRTM